ncbi:MAG: hypothetical protein QGI64_06465, partial [Desulfobacterales bacterium]|nr:hypothetical protein [Desulfobacterales bacterium]
HPVSGQGSGCQIMGDQMVDCAEYLKHREYHFFLYLVFHYCYLMAYKFRMTSPLERRIRRGVKKFCSPWTECGSS